MSIDRPRRIFRRSSRPARGGIHRTLAVGLFGAAAGAAIVMAASPGDLSGHAAPGPLEIVAAGNQVMAVDGGTLRLGAVVVQLSDVVAPARGQACAAGPDCGERATAALARLVQDRRVACRVAWRDAGGRPIGRCDADGTDINAALVEVGWARASARALEPKQDDARAHRRGMWLAG